MFANVAINVLTVAGLVCNCLTQFKPMFCLYTPEKHPKTSGFTVFSKNIEMDHWPISGVYKEVIGLK